MEQFKLQWHCLEISCYRRWGRCSFPLQTVEKVSIWTLQQWQFSCWWPWSIVIRPLRWRVTKRLLLKDQRVAIIWRGIMINLNQFTLYINILNPDFIATNSRETSHFFRLSSLPVPQSHVWRSMPSSKRSEPVPASKKCSTSRGPHLETDWRGRLARLVSTFNFQLRT